MPAAARTAPALARHPDEAEAFSAGTDARLAGRPRSANPHTTFAERRARRWWADGWADCDAHWALQAWTHRRAVRRLPVAAR